MAKITAIKENHLFSKVYSKGKSTAGRYFVVYALRNFCSHETKLGITASKKLGGAVQRSRVRRLAREAFRQIFRERSTAAPYLLVIVARSAVFREGVKMQEVSADLEHSMQKLHLLRQEEAH